MINVTKNLVSLYYPERRLKIGILHKLKSTSSISEKQLQFLSDPQESRPRYLYVLPKIDKILVVGQYESLCPHEDH